MAAVIMERQYVVCCDPSPDFKSTPLFEFENLRKSGPTRLIHTYNASNLHMLYGVILNDLR